MTQVIINEVIDQIINDYDIFYGKDNIVYISIPYNDSEKKRIVPIDSCHFKDFILLKYRDAHKPLSTKNFITTCRDYISAYARNNTEQEEIFRRVGMRNKAIYVNNVGVGKTYRISKHYIKPVTNPKCRLYQDYSSLPLPIPNLDKFSIEPLWNLVNITDQYQKKLLLVWILNSFYTITNYPILVFYGEKGTAKSTSQKYLKNLIDPSTASQKALSRSIDDMAVNAANCHVLEYNNVLKLSKQMQNDMCMISTGGTFTNRKKYSDRDEASNDLRKPMMLNGISPFIDAEDLLDRCIIFKLKTIRHKQRKEEVLLDEYFRQHHDKLLE